MNDDSLELQRVIDRLGQGDEAARRLLLERACERLRRLAAHLLHQSFPGLAQRHEVDSIVHESWLRLFQALEKVRPPTVADFFRLAAHKIRQVLLDLVARQRRLSAAAVPFAADADGSTRDPGSRTLDPARLAIWSEFHQGVAELPDAQKAVFELHYYLELPQAEIARLLNLHPRKVSYLWVAATEELARKAENVADFF